LNVEYDRTGSKLWVISFYREQLRKFEKVGLGKLTENDVKITNELIAITTKRLEELIIVYENTLDVSYKERKKRAKRRLFSGQTDTHNNGTTVTSGMQNNGDTRHARKKS
tara:strand:- start:25 stop:354 length:330 start_codon:yes stop_codon:yes gene_type:complete